MHYIRNETSGKAYLTAVEVIVVTRPAVSKQAGSKTSKKDARSLKQEFHVISVRCLFSIQYLEVGALFPERWGGTCINNVM
jgi:hypothetical protein